MTFLSLLRNRSIVSYDNGSGEGSLYIRKRALEIVPSTRTVQKTVRVNGARMRKARCRALIRTTQRPCAFQHGSARTMGDSSRTESISAGLFRMYISRRNRSTCGMHCSVLVLFSLACSARLHAARLVGCHQLNNQRMRMKIGMRVNRVLLYATRE